MRTSNGCPNTRAFDDDVELQLFRLLRSVVDKQLKRGIALEHVSCNSDCTYERHQESAGYFEWLPIPRQEK